jgi:hypothetical protein
MKGETLQKVDHQPYLGVELSSNLKYNLHIDQTYKKASKVLVIFFISVLIFPNLDLLPFSLCCQVFCSHAACSGQTLLRSFGGQILIC